MHSFFNYTIDFFFPQGCCFCGVLGRSMYPLCVACRRALQLVASIDITLTKARQMRVYAAGAYVGGLKRLVLRKYVRDYLASYELARIIALCRVIHCAQYDYLIPVPMHWTRRLWRGYNQAELITHELSDICGVPVCHALERTRSTQVQTGLSAQQRQDNLSNAFMLNGEYALRLKDARIALIDDVYTTGSTVREAARALLPVRPAKIDVIVAARAI